MTLKFNLNKYAKIDRIEEYPISEVQKLWTLYTEYLEKNNNKDIVDMPNLDLSFD